MAMAPKLDKFLMKRGPVWYYQRFVPKKFSHVDTRKRVRYSLNTPSVEIARLRRDALVEADDNYWRSLALEAADNDGVTEAKQLSEEKLYKAATTRALFFGYIYKTVDKLAKEENSQQILDRIDILKAQSGPDELPHISEIDALLGGTPEPTKRSVSVSKAFQLYLDDIAHNEVIGKSPKQYYTWKKVKTTSVNYFIDTIGDVGMEEITREMALSYRSWWIERMIPGDEQLNPAKPNTANRHIGNIRRLYEDYFTHIGDEDRLNPFRKMFFKDNQETNVPSFENDWVRTKILSKGTFDELNDELRTIIYVLIETGARASEICNLLPEHIILDSGVPHIAIRPKGRELKTWTSKRELPLVGVALEAMKMKPNGFPRYRDKGELVSANLMKAFRQRKLFPTSNHVIYSFRHAFEDRMLEADIDYGMRCYLMGHKNSRPNYGKTGSLEYRREQLLKIVHPFQRNIFKY